jgi:uncharacterized protein (TIGR00369 family)
MTVEAVDQTYIKDNPNNYPPNIQAILKRPSGASAILGLELLEIDKDANRVRIAFHASQDICNKWGGIHGGMVAAMLDDLNSIAVGLTLDWGQISPTLEMKTSYIAAARPGTLIGEGWVVKRGKSVAFTEAELRDDKGTLLATSSSTASFVTLKK